MGDMSSPLPLRPLMEWELRGPGVWQFKQSDDKSEDAWMPVASIPSTVHQDLMDNKRLEDPFVGFNEIKAEWVANKSWTYRTRIFNYLSDIAGVFVLDFQGLDTFADIKLNGKTILKTNNMFIPYRVDITPHLIPKDNLLEIEFSPALLKAREIQNQHPEHKFVAFNGEPARVAVRKAQYHWGWDWGPLLMCAGIWRSVRAEIYLARIADLRIDVDVARDYRSALIRTTVDVEDYSNQDIIVQVDVSLESKIICSGKARMAKGVARIELNVTDPELWMPNGYGQQPLYTVQANLLNDGETIHSSSKRIGIRKLELIQELDSHGKSFYFRINGVDIFCGGSCWIPADSFLTNVTRERYRAWIELMVPANQKMIRVWGGGIYEDDAFYDVCDELGILVWQDFMFACGNYPCFPEFLESIETEAVANVRRIRHHPCLAIFAGNNEDYQVAEQVGLHYDFSDKDEKSWLKSDFPARYIYESILPRITAAEAPSIPYHPGSPWGDGKDTSDKTVGDIHQWNVWHGTQEKYQIFDSLGGRFNSEFGMEAFPHIDTIKSFVEDDKDLYPQSHVLDFHNKADGHERRIATYLVENVRTATDLEAYIHLTQLIQSEALMYGYRGWRKQWGEERHCGGALVWQLNDCWPVTSWSIVDYYLRRKPAYYAMARVLAPIAIGIRRAHHDWSVTHARDPKIQDWECWIVSSNLQAAVADLVEIRFISIETGKDIKEAQKFHHVKLASNGTTNVAKGVVNNETEEPHVLFARVVMDSHRVASDVDWPQPLKYLSFSDRGLNVDVQKMSLPLSTDSNPSKISRTDIIISNDVKADSEAKRDNPIETKIIVTCNKPVKCLVFEERQGCHLSDSAIDVVPGEQYVVDVKGLKHDDPDLKWRYLGMNEQ